MLTSNRTEDRIIAIMQKGGKLIYTYRYHPEFGTSLISAALIYNGKTLQLAEREYYARRPDSDGPIWRTLCPVGDAIIKRPDVRRGYPGYQSDYSELYREAYEHCNAPVPRWIREQWATPIAQYDE